MRHRIRYAAMAATSYLTAVTYAASWVADWAFDSSVRLNRAAAIRWWQHLPVDINEDTRTPPWMDADGWADEL